MKAELPDLKLLQIFVAVVRWQGFANARQELQLSQAAISGAMSQLEAQLGVVLCQRGRSGFRFSLDQSWRAVLSTMPATSRQVGRLWPLRAKP